MTSLDFLALALLWLRNTVLFIDSKTWKDRIKYAKSAEVAKAKMYKGQWR